MTPAWTRGISEDRYGLDKIFDCLSRFGISGIDSLGQSALKLDDEVTGDSRPGAIIEARSQDDLTNTRGRPAFSRAFRGSVKAEIIVKASNANANQWRMPASEPAPLV